MKKIENKRKKMRDYRRICPCSKTWIKNSFLGAYLLVGMGYSVAGCGRLVWCWLAKAAVEASDRRRSG
ncbi:hypothetical protein QYF36_014513 [Acer negundo]|nr:hypothetical protein QYF36_014513 [Acer negundo]